MNESKDPVDCSAHENRPPYTWASHSGPTACYLKDVLQQKGRHSDILALWVTSEHGGYKYLSTCLCKLKYKNNKPWQFVPQGSKCLEVWKWLYAKVPIAAVTQAPKEVYQMQSYSTYLQFPFTSHLSKGERKWTDMNLIWDTCAFLSRMYMRVTQAPKHLHGLV